MFQYEINMNLLVIKKQGYFKPNHNGLVIKKCVYIHLAMINIALTINAIFIIAKCIYTHFCIYTTAINRIVLSS